MASIIILIGIPASGKSSLAQSLERSRSVQIVSPDSIRQQLYGSSGIQGDWQEIFAQVTSQLQQCFAAQQSVVYDATNCDPRHRGEMIKLAKNLGFTPVSGIWLNVPLWVCLERNELRANPVPEAVIMNMYKTLMGRSPNLREGFDYLMIKEEGTIDDALL